MNSNAGKSRKIDGTRQVSERESCQAQNLSSKTMKSWKLSELQEAAKSPAGVFFVARPTASQKKPRVAACFFRGYGEDNEEEQEFCKAQSCHHQCWQANQRRTQLCRDASDRQVKLTQCYVNAEGTCGDGRHCGSPKTITKYKYLVGKVPLNKNVFTFPLLFCMRNYNSKADATAAKRPQHVVIMATTAMC